MLTNEDQKQVISTLYGLKGILRSFFDVWIFDEIFVKKYGKSPFSFNFFSNSC